MEKSQEEPLLPLHADDIHIETSSPPEYSTPLHSDDFHTEKALLPKDCTPSHSDDPHVETPSPPEEPLLPFHSDDIDIEKALPQEDSTSKAPKSKTSLRVAITFRWIFFIILYTVTIRQCVWSLPRHDYHHDDPWQFLILSYYMNFVTLHAKKGLEDEFAADLKLWGVPQDLQKGLTPLFELLISGALFSLGVVFALLASGTSAFEA